MQLKLEVGKLLEQHGLICEEDGELQDELHDGELLDGEMDEILHDFIFDELQLLLKLVDIELELEDFRLLELQ